jgi:predicted aspartyl protease
MPPRPFAAAARIASALAAGAALCAQAPLYPPAEIATAVMQAELDRHQRMTVPVTINGAGPYRFLVDTGAQATVVTARVTDALGLVPSGRATLVAMASRVLVDTIALDGLEFAGRRFNNLTTPLLRDRDIGADGIIGLDSLQELRVVIDFRADAITVSDAPEGDRDGYEIVVRARRKLGQMIITDALVEGVRTAVIIDTGSWHSIANLALERRLRSKHSDTMVSTDVNGAQLESNVAMVRDLRIGRLGLSNVLLGFTDSPAFEALGLAKQPALILGIGNLRPFDRVAIDFASRRVLFDVPKGAGADRLDSLFALSRSVGG